MSGPHADISDGHNSVTRVLLRSNQWEIIYGLCGRGAPRNVGITHTCLQPLKLANSDLLHSLALVSSMPEVPQKKTELRLG